MDAVEIVNILKLLPEDPLTVGKVALALMNNSIAPTLSMSNQIAAPTINNPQETMPAGNVMIPAGHMCECDLCKVVVYEIISNVLEHMPKKDFVACFKPLGEASELKMPLDTWADSSGNLAIDCPLCKGTKTLWIKGHGDIPFNDVPEQTK